MRELLRDMGREGASEAAVERLPHRPASGSEGKERRRTPGVSVCGSRLGFSVAAAFNKACTVRQPIEGLEPACCMCGSMKDSAQGWVSLQSASWSVS